MRNKERLSSPRMRSEVAGTQRSEVDVDGGTLSLKILTYETRPPSPLQGTSPRKRGEETTPQTLSYPKPSTVSAHHCNRPSGSITDVQHA